jgi:tetratricopeptide (TPR) repeat protein/predicted Ser/Thr protein kinase
MGERDKDGVQSTADMLGHPPGVDPIALERARARAESRLFGAAAPARIGRYEVTDNIGRGGMGVVYSAFDPQLQRKVALKVLHPLRNQDAGSQQRMVIEARALAKLDHPNIVKVHDALLENDQVVVVMELLEGETLESWQVSRDRDWRAIVAVYAQAADGLAAAHGVGVVHRDFKPSNAIIARDGRVRVVDFGLARVSSDEVEPSPGAMPTQTGQTASGAVVGTLGYAAPEQLAASTVTPASDQFSFCVALHAAIEGVHPFEGDDRVTRLAAIERGTLRRSAERRSVPAWLRAVIARGLAVDPADRFPSMSGLVRELRRPRGWRRWRLPVVGATLVGIAITVTALVYRRDVESCDGAAALAAQTWNPQIREHIRTAIGHIATPYTAAVRDRVVDRLDRYSIDWQAAHRSVCRAHQRGETSATLLDRQMLCLSRRLGDLRAAIDVLGSVDESSIGQVMDVASAIPSTAPCLDIELMQSDVAPPASLEMRARIDAIRTQISSSEALARAGRSEAALAILGQARAAADATPYAPIRVDVALAEGRILLAQGELDRAIVSLGIARDGAFGQQMLSPALEAAARIIYAEGAISPQLDRLQGEIAVLLPLSEGLRGDYFTRPLLLNNIGTVYVAAGQRAEAATYFERAKAEIRRHDTGNLELTNVDLNLAMLTSDTPKREALARSVWETFRDTLGEQHLSTLDALNAYAGYVDDPRVALEAVTRALQSYEQFHPTAHRAIAVDLARAALLGAETGDIPQSNALYDRAIATMANDTDPDLVALRQLCAGELALQQGNPTRASTELRRVFDARSTSTHWWERADALRAEVGLGQAAFATGDDRAAIQYLDAAIRDYPTIASMNEQVEYKRFAARARLALSRVLVHAKRDLVRAKSLAADAHAFYRVAGPKGGYAWILSGEGVRNGRP